MKPSITAQRILPLVQTAYDNQGADAIERQLIDNFVDGLNTDQLKMKSHRDQHATLQGAVVVATNEQNLRPCVQMSHHSGYTSTQHMQHTHQWRLTTLAVNGLRTDLDLTRSAAAHNHKPDAGVMANQVT